jgi:hypothetical protein
MPVKRFRSLAEAKRASWLEPGDPRSWEAARHRWAIHRALGRPSAGRGRGVFKFTSIEEKQRRTDLA